MRRGEERVSPAPRLGHFLFEFLIYILFMPHASLFLSPFWGSQVTGLRNDVSKQRWRDVYLAENLPGDSILWCLRDFKFSKGQ